MLHKRKERTVEELYSATDVVMQPKITPVLRGSYRMQGPVDETDHDTQTNMVSFQSENKFDNCSMSRKVHMRGESGACNVCAAPCSSCMHFSRAIMGSKTDEYSDENCRVNIGSQYSVNGGDTSSSFKSKTCDSLQHTTSETSNLISVNSSHDSLSENADSKATLRSSNVADTLEVEMLPKLSSGGTTEEVELSPKPLCDIYSGAFTNKYEDPKGVEAHDDNISCVSRVNDAYASASNASRSVDRKNLSCSSASVSSLGPEESRKAHELVLSEVPPSKDVGAGISSPKEKKPSSYIQGKLPEGSLGHVDSSLVKDALADVVSDHKTVACKVTDPKKICLKAEAGNINDDGTPTNEVLKCSDQGQGEQEEKSSELGIGEPHLPSMSGDESDESDIVEHDVKVCDICGDAGREDMLAICSRCSDGAEHTYCMRKMLKSVPRGNWLCEECKFAEESSSQKQETEGKRMNKVSSSTHFSGKRIAENVEVAPAAKRQALEMSMGSPKASSPNRMGVLSRESSFKNLDKERVRSAQQTCLGNQSTNDMLETSRSSTAGPRLQTPKGTLLKSNSFNAGNSKPKVKLVDEVVPQKQKGAKEHTSLDIKERPSRMISKSMSFKSVNSSRSNVSDSKVKIISPKFSNVVDLKGLKQAKERNAFERKNLSKLDRPPVSSTTASSTASTLKADQASRVESSLVSHVSNNRDLKVVQCEGKPNISTKSTSNLARKTLETPIMSSVGASSTICGSATEQKLNQVSSKDEILPTYSSAIDKPSNNFDGTPPDGLPRLQETINQADKARESSVRPRPSAPVSPKVGDLDAAVPSVGKPMVKDFLGHASATLAFLSKFSPIPEYEYIWQGCFEVHRSGNILDLYGGIQAHLSTCASPRVLEMLHKFPQKLFLNEVPRMSTWPMQFHDGGAKEDNIALYFFAKDLESYERKYKSLLDGMIKNDLALKGNVEGVELLIFPSNQLPEKSQRWNMLFFLWGVFRTRRMHGPDSSKNVNIPSLDGISVEKHTPTAVMTLSENLCSPKRIDEESSSCGRNSNMFLTSNVPAQICAKVTVDCDEQKASPELTCLGLKANSVLKDSQLVSKSTSGVRLSEEMRCTSPSLQEVGLPKHGMGADVRPSLPAIGTHGSNMGEKMQLDRNYTSSLKTPLSNQEVVGVSGNVYEEKFSDSLGVSGSVGDMMPLDGVKRDGDQYKLEREVKEEDEHVNAEAALARDPMTKAVNCYQPSQRKRPHIDLMDTAPPASDLASQKMPWNGVNNMPIDGASIGKKPKTGSINMYEYSGRNSLGDGISSQGNDLGPCSLVEEKRCVESCDEKVIPEDFGTTERFFFPVDSRHVKVGDSFASRRSFSTGNEERSHDGFPNLELALGAETKPQNKGILPFFVGVVDKKNNQDKPPDKLIDDKEDDVSASLSLSLSFPFPDKEQPVKPVSKSEQLRAERRHVNTSLLLFGGFPEK
ncbi:protein PARALOG OF AIPP2 isoform X6 [Ziziphus jujuba]|uniref:Protein PARALOG OF AIPP2 isoform X6 n=1 Tax=Ziziphus jujuba TaxID=326968 RepID=A0ABM4AFW6_ZIZJJ|nr:protein PARALOG OF AIPP2 isoform X6 [Ziziphus jujuba]